MMDLNGNGNDKAMQVNYKSLYIFSGPLQTTTWDEQVQSAYFEERER